jgi:hypothetical protein
MQHEECVAHTSAQLFTGDLKDGDEPLGRLAGFESHHQHPRYLLTRRTVQRMFRILVRSLRSQFRYVRKPESESSPAFAFMAMER